MTKMIRICVFAFICVLKTNPALACGSAGASPSQDQSAPAANDLGRRVCLGSQ
jgi:hypothetical protein